MKHTIVHYKEWRCVLVEHKFAIDGSKRFDLVDTDPQDQSPIATCNVYLPGLEPNEIAIPEYKYPGMTAALHKAGVIDNCIRFIPSGHVRIAVYELNPEYI